MYDIEAIGVHSYVAFIELTFAAEFLVTTIIAIY